MRPPPLTKLRKEELGDAPKWFDTVIGILNDFIEPVYQIFSNNINFVDNFDGQEYSDVINQTKIDNGYRIKVTMKARPKGVILLSIVKVAGAHVPFTTAPFVDWLYSEGFITIYGITGIDSTSDYRVLLQIV